MGEPCAAHALLDDRIRRQEQDYQVLSKSILNLQDALLEEMEKINEKVETIHSKLMGDFDTDGIGYIAEVKALKKSVDSIEIIKVKLDKITPWVSVYKWFVLTLSPVFLMGFLTLLTGLLTGKIKIIM